jgi:probable F420-dependent oxidoreductase
MKVGLMGLNFGPLGHPGVIPIFVRTAERLGFESVDVIEHICVPVKHLPYPGTPDGQVPGGDRNPIAEPLGTLAFAAALTSRIKLITGVLLLPLHHPIYLAKQLATVDLLSHGRLIVGISNGWCREEYQALGIEWRTRGRRTDEAIAAMRALWRNDAAALHGRLFDFPEVYSFPKPVRPDGIPILIGGYSPASARRAGRIGDGFFPIVDDRARLRELISLMRTTAREHGRNPDAIEITVGAPSDLEAIRSLRDLGVSRVILRPPTIVPVELEGALERIANDVVSKI